MPRYWPTPISRGSPSSRGAHTFPGKRPNASRATPAGWSCATTARAAWWRSGPGPGRFPPHYGAPSSIGIKAAASRGAMGASPRGITSATGPTAGRPRSPTSPCSVAAITAPCTRRGYQVARLPDGTLQFRRPNGHPLPEVPPPAAVPADPIKALHESHDAQGLRVHARTGCPSWLGEGLNVGWAIDVLHPLAQRARPSPPEQGSSAAYPSIAPLAATPPPMPE